MRPQRRTQVVLQPGIVGVQRRFADHQAHFQQRHNVESRVRRLQYASRRSSRQRGTTAFVAMPVWDRRRVVILVGLLRMVDMTMAEVMTMLTLGQRTSNNAAARGSMRVVETTSQRVMNQHRRRSQQCQDGVHEMGFPLVDKVPRERILGVVIRTVNLDRR